MHAFKVVASIEHVRGIALGLEPVVLPFTQVEALPQAPLEGPFDAIVVTSANALRHFSQIRRFVGLPLLAVGDATAQAARDLGFEDVRSAGADVRALSAMLESDIRRDARLLYLCGQTRTPALEEWANTRRQSMQLLETYATNKVSQLTNKLDAHFAASKPEIVLFHSGVSASIFLQWLDGRSTMQRLDSTTFVVISERVSGLIWQRLNARIAIARTPDEAAMLDAVKQLLIG